MLHGRTRLAHHHVQCRQPHRKIGERLEREISRRSPMSVLRAKEGLKSCSACRTVCAIVGNSTGGGRQRPTSIQNGSSRLLISQDFLPRSGTNRHLQDALRNKRFSRASGTTADQRARSSSLRAARQIAAGAVYFSAPPVLASHGPSLPCLPALRARCPRPANESASLSRTSPVGEYSRERLVRMNDRFVDRVERANRRR